VSNPPVRALPVRLSAANNADHCVHNLPFDWLPDNRTSYQGIKCRSLTTPWHALAIKNAEWGAKITRKITGLLLFSPPPTDAPECEYPTKVNIIGPEALHSRTLDK